MRRTPLVLLVTLVLVSGCEEQEAVPLSKSVPIAGLQALALLAPVIGGFLLLERSARRRSEPAPERRPLDVAGALLFGGVGVVVVAGLLLAILANPGAYDQDTINVLSWEDSVLLTGFFIIPVVAIALFELRLAAACWTRRSWALWGAGLQLGVLATSVVASLVPGS